MASGIRLPLISDWNPAGINKARRDFEKLETTGQKATLALKKAFIPATAALAGLAAASGLAVKAAAEDAAQQTELARQLRATTGATDAAIAANEEFIAGMEIAVAVSDGELRPALANLVRGTGDLAQAQDLLGIALDVSAATGKDLNAVTEAMAKAAGGQMTALQRLDPSLAAVIRSGADAEEVFATMADTFGGAAAEAANTVEGRFSRMKIQMDNATEAIGYALLPIVEKLLPVLERLARFVGDNTDTIVAMGAAVGTFAAAIVAANVAMRAWSAMSAITLAVNAALSTSFTVLQVASGVILFTALVGVFVLLQQKFDIFGKAVDVVTWYFKQWWKVASAVLDGVVSGINLLIRAWNKIPFLDDIPEIEFRFSELGDSVDATGEAMDNATGPAANMSYELAEMNRFAEIGQRQLAGALIPTVEKVGASFDYATIELKAFYGELDRKAGLDKFNAELDAIQEELTRLTPGTEAYIRKFEEGQRLVGGLSDEIKRIPAALELQLQLTGDLDRLQRIINLAGMTDTYRPSGQDEMRFIGAGTAGGATTININMPAGSNGADVIDSINRETRRTGTATIANSGLIRR